MPTLPIATAGDGRLTSLTESKNIRTDGCLYEVTIVCPLKKPDGTSNSNGVAVGADKVISLWLAPADSITFLTRAIGEVCWQDINGGASFLSIFYAPHEVVPVEH